MKLPCFVLVVFPVFLLLSSASVLAAHTEKTHRGDPNVLELFKTKDKSTTVVTECMHVAMEESTFFRKTYGLNEDTCGLYLLARPDQRIEITVEAISVECEAGGLITILDGWEMQGEVFPPVADLPLNERTVSMCGREEKQVVMTSSNAATLLYRMPTPGDSYKITARFLKHPKPCNVLVTDGPKSISISNHGQRRNCSIGTVFPATVVVQNLNVGEGKSHSSNALAKNRMLGSGKDLPWSMLGGHFKSYERRWLAGGNGGQGVFDECESKGFPDFVDVGGSIGLNTVPMQVEKSLCGKGSYRGKASHIFCEVTSVRLVSSGATLNSVQVSIAPIQDLASALPTLLCGAPAPLV